MNFSGSIKIEGKVYLIDCNSDSNDLHFRELSQYTDNSISDNDIYLVFDNNGDNVEFANKIVKLVDEGFSFNDIYEEMRPFIV